ncbi:CU044_2847 family protein [Streptomyces sp. NPDC059176]|uniref:CU044_2847 family protein n=1 Tax=unclassified Streptomyces TaxID=2593676 RepID=UPI0036A11655
MPEYMDVELTDGSHVRMELSGAGDTLAVTDRKAVSDDLPEGFGSAVPVARGGGEARATTRAADALRTVLRPMGPLLDEIHSAVAGAENAPSEITVAFGVEIGQDLKLGIVGANGKATITVSATWQPGQRQN